MTITVKPNWEWSSTTIIFRRCNVQCNRVRWGGDARFRAVIVDDAGNELEPGQEGHLAMDTKASPLFWFAGYYNAPDRTRERFTLDGRYYLTGDDASHDPEGHFYFPVAPMTLFSRQDTASDHSR